jgi:hypothetical protein
VRLKGCKIGVENAKFGQGHAVISFEGVKKRARIMLVSDNSKEIFFSRLT